MADLGPAIIGLTGVLAGGIITGTVSVMAAKSQERIALQRFAHERELLEREELATGAQQRRAFQRETLLALQEALAEEARATGAIFAQDQPQAGGTRRHQ